MSRVREILDSLAALEAVSWSEVNLLELEAYLRQHRDVMQAFSETQPLWTTDELQIGLKHLEAIQIGVSARLNHVHEQRGRARQARKHVEAKKRELDENKAGARINCRA